MHNLILSIITLINGLRLTSNIIVNRHLLLYYNNCKVTPKFIRFKTNDNTILSTFLSSRRLHILKVLRVEQYYDILVI